MHKKQVKRPRCAKFATQKSLHLLYMRPHMLTFVLANGAYGVMQGARSAMVTKWRRKVTKWLQIVKFFTMLCKLYYVNLTNFGKKICAK